MEGIPERIDSKFRFVLLAARRAEQMMRGSMPKNPLEGEKLTRLALAEVRDDEIEWDYGPPPVEEEEETAEAAATAEEEVAAKTE